MATTILLGPHHSGDGGGHHHGGGGGRWHGGGGNWYAPDVFVVSPCADNYAPVLGTDGMTYRNACYAMQAGVGVAQQLHGPLDTLSSPMRWFVIGALGLVAIAGGLVAYRHLK